MDAGATRPSFPPNLGLDLEAKTLKRGGVYSFDTSAVLDDYTADICRVAVVGRANQHHKDLYEKCLKLNDAVRKTSKAGVRTREVWEVYIKTIEDLGASTFIRGRGLPDRIGHGFGLLGNEPPTLGPNDQYRLEAGNIHCIEPGVGAPGEWYYIEENVWVTNTGTELLSEGVSRDLFEI
jgi:Xaa-Pro aminopeptidase